MSRSVPGPPERLRRRFAMRPLPDRRAGHATDMRRMPRATLVQVAIRMPPPSIPPHCRADHGDEPDGVSSIARSASRWVAAVAMAVSFMVVVLFA